MQLIAESYDLLRSVGRARAGARSPTIFRDVERGRPRVLPHRDHRRGAASTPTPRPGKPFVDVVARPGRAEGHRPLDRAERARPRRPGHRHRRGGVRPRRCPGTPRSARPPAALRGPDAAARSTAGDDFVDDVRAGAVRLQGRRLRAGLRPIVAGAARVRLGHRPRRDRHDLARRLHHPRPVPRTASATPTSASPTSDAARGRRTSPTRSRDGAGRLAAGGRHRGAGRASRRPASPRRSPTTTRCARERLPAALIQALRDYFGAHTYRRVDRDGAFHTLWSGDRSEVTGG